MTLLLAAVGVLLGSGALALAAARSGRLATRLAVGGAVLAGVLGLVPAVATLFGYAVGPADLRLPWMTELGGSFHVALDGLSAFFLVIVFGVGALTAVYGGAYLLPLAGRKNLGLAWCFFNALLASMVVVVVARNGLLFLVAWELMALTSYFLVVFDGDDPAVRKAGWFYLVATHLGTVFLLVLFGLLRWPDGSLDFPARVPAELAGVVFVLALVGFGAKAGLVPLHVWLPEAHPVAPSHVSALLSAVMIKLGIYGILRTVTLLGPPELWWGPVLAGVGLLGALVGVGQALYQRDLKRALAYSSVENVGLIALGLGVGLWGVAADVPAVAALGLAGGLLHVWNHALMKGLMFLAAGSVLHGTGTRDLEKLGGLMKPMPWTATLLVAGAVALAALPPLNGFVGEWLIYLGLLRAGLHYPDSRGLAALLAVGALAVVGGLAAICFVRLAGIAALGTPRSEAAAHAHEAGHAMRWPMVLLAGLCVVSGVCPGLVLDALAAPLDQILGPAGPAARAGLAESGASATTLGLANAAVWLALGGVAGVLVWLARRNGVAAHGTWGCGYAAPTPRIQYTARSFSAMMAERLLPRPFRPRVHRTGPAGLFPGPATFTAECPDPVTERGYEPLFRRVARGCVRLWVVQQGTVNLYIMYLLLLIFLGLAWLSVREWVGG